MAIQCLQLKSNPKYSVVVISVHNYSKRSGKEAPTSFAYLLFDFLKKLEVPVLIAGDFNLDITDPKMEHSLANDIRKYTIEEYDMRSLRKKKERKDRTIATIAAGGGGGGGATALDENLPKIDFNLLGNVDGALFESSLHETIAHDLQPSTASNIALEEITNHNPLSATLIVKKKKMTK